MADEQKPVTEYYDETRRMEPEECIQGLPAKETVTMRDYFAAKAMQGHMASLNAGPAETNVAWMETSALRYYQIADAMIKARAQ